jgi:hypothetical protein
MRAGAVLRYCSTRRNATALPGAVRWCCQYQQVARSPRGTLCWKRLHRRWHGRLLHFPKHTRKGQQRPAPANHAAIMAAVRDCLAIGAEHGVPQAHRIHFYPDNGVVIVHGDRKLDQGKGGEGSYWSGAG